MKNTLIRSFHHLLLLTAALSLPASAISASESEFMRLSGHIPRKAVENAAFLNRVEGSTHVPITFVLSLRNQEELAELIDRIHDPADEQHYGKYLTTAEFIERFAPTQADYDKVIAYAKNLGLNVHNTHPNRMLLNVSGSAHAIESAFNVNLHQYLSSEGRQFYAPNDEPEVDSSIAAVINGMVGLDNHAKLRPFHHRKERGHQEPAVPKDFPSGPGGGFSPSDLVKAYNLSGVSTNGANQIIALFELAGYQVSDINAYTNYFGLPSAKLKNILVDGGSSDGIDAEVTLDIELALALAPESEIYVYEGPNSNQGVLDTYNRIATDNLAKQVSTSWGSGEDLANAQFLQAESAIFQQMAVQGQTIYAAAGDSGAFDDYPDKPKTPIVDDPASQPYVVGVGGTRLTVNANTGAYQMESVWNDGLGNGAGGGGVSQFWAIPSWQTNVSTVYSKTHRNVPDVALNADTNTGYAIYYNGNWQIYGGTSCAAPLWAAFTACVNQSLAETKRPALGFANPILYALANGVSYATDFHDVTTGNNLYYQASAGYDNASGWGSFNGGNLYASLTSLVTAPRLNIVLKHNAPFTQGQVCAYRIAVSNTGTGPTSGPVHVTMTLPDGLTYHSFSGSGWVLDQGTLTFTQDGVLNPGASFPTLILNVDVADHAPGKIDPSVVVSGGGSVSKMVDNLTTTHM